MRNPQEKFAFLGGCGSLSARKAVARFPRYVEAAGAQPLRLDSLSMGGWAKRPPSYESRGPSSSACRAGRRATLKKSSLFLRAADPSPVGKQGARFPRRVEAVAAQPSRKVCLRGGVAEPPQLRKQGALSSARRAGRCGTVEKSSLLMGGGGLGKSFLAT